MVHALLEADPGLEKVADLLGGNAVLGQRFLTVLDAHDIIYRGLPSKSLVSLLEQMPSIAREIDNVLGVSTRTLQRHKKDGAKDLLSRGQSGRLYRVAEIAAKAIGVFGSSEDAQRFLEEPAMALDGKRPIDLLSTPAGAQLVERHLIRLDYGVYT